MDMVSLTGKLPNLIEAAEKWITEFVESIAQQKLVLGDMKAILMHVVGKQTIEKIF